MTIYEKENDHGLAGTWNSLVWGSAGRPIACCNIRGYSIVKPNGPYDIIKKDGRGLDDEYEEDEIDDEEYHEDEGEYEQEVDIMTLEEFQEIFGDEIDPINFFEEQAGGQEGSEDGGP